MYLVSKNTVDCSTHHLELTELVAHLLRCSKYGGRGEGSDLPYDHLYLRNGAVRTGFRSSVTHLLYRSMPYEHEVLLVLYLFILQWLTF